jgi:hypothetical protein
MDSIICKQHDPHYSFSLPAQNHQRGSSNFSELCLMETWKIVILAAKTNTDKDVVMLKMLLIGAQTAY